MEKMAIFGIDVLAETENFLIKKLFEISDKVTISTLSVPMLFELTKNSVYQNAVRSSQIVLPDGMGIVWASKIIFGKNGLKRRIAGPDFFLRFSKIAQKRRGKYFLLGSTPEVLEKIIVRIKREFSNIKVVGFYAPPFYDWDEKENLKIIELINSSRADILWVAMTAPKQEIWVFENRDHIDVKIVASIGAAFDFFARTTKRAPDWMRKIGFEWLFRFMKEPYRMGKRYLRGFCYFILLVAKSKISGK